MRRNGRGGGSATLTANEATLSPDGVVTWGHTMGTVATSATLTDAAGHVLTLSSFSDNGTTGSATFPAPADGQPAINFETGVTLSVTDGTTTVTDTIDLTPAANHSVVTVETGFSTTGDSWLAGASGSAPAIGDQAYYQSANMTLTGTGGASGETGTHTGWYIDTSDASPTWEEFTITFGTGSTGIKLGLKSKTSLAIGIGL